MRITKIKDKIRMDSMLNYFWHNFGYFLDARGV